MSSLRPWRQAWHEALYGPAGFYRRERPGDHFRTAGHAAPDLVAEALATLAVRHGLTRVIEIGCGSGELLAELHRVRPELTLVGVEMRPRPASVPGAVGWQAEVPRPDERPTLLLGWELLDVVPVSIAERCSDGLLREVLVDTAGREALGAPISGADEAWCRRWNPSIRPGERVEIGRPRDELWSALVDRLPVGVALAVDYGHDGPSRVPTLTAFRGGRRVDPAPDGRCDLTSHVRWDSLSAAVSDPRRRTRLITQRQALRELVHHELPVDRGLATKAPVDYLTRLARRSRHAELTDPDGLGAFGWLITELGSTELGSITELGSPG